MQLAAAAAARCSRTPSVIQQQPRGPVSHKSQPQLHGPLLLFAHAGMQDDAESSDEGDGGDDAAAGPPDANMEDDSMQDFEGHGGEWGSQWAGSEATPMQLQAGLASLQQQQAEGPCIPTIGQLLCPLHAAATGTTAPQHAGVHSSPAVAAMVAAAPMVAPRVCACVVSYAHCLPAVFLCRLQMLCWLLHGVLCSQTWWQQAGRMTKHSYGG